MNENVQPITEIEQYYEALYMMRISKPGSTQEAYWKARVEDLESTVKEIRNDIWF